MKKSLLIGTFFVSAFCCFQVSATDLTKALDENKPLSEIRTLIQNGTDVNQPDEESGWYPLMYAKDIDTLKLLIQKGANIHAETEYTSVFQQICAEGTLEMVQEMVRAGADINKIVGSEYIKGTPLMAALSNKDPRVVSFLIQSGADVGAKIPDALGDNTALKSAIMHDADPEIIKILIDNGADIHQKDNFDDSFYAKIAAHSSHPELIPLFQQAGLDLGKENLNSLFLNAIQFNHSFEMAKYLIELGADPNVQGEKEMFGRVLKDDYPIIVAAQAVRPDALKFLLERNVNVNVTDKDGKSPLALLQKNQYLAKDPDYNKYIVALGGQPLSADEAKRSQNSMQLLDDVRDNNKTIADIEKLIQDGLDINYKNKYGKTALMNALDILSEESFYELKSKYENIFKDIPDYPAYLKKRLDITDFLLKHGADIHQKDERGNNLLFIAVWKDNPQLLEYLISKGIDVNEANNHGQTPLMKAAKSENGIEMIKILLKHGADKTIKDKDGRTAYKHITMFNMDPKVKELLAVTPTINHYDLPPAAQAFYAKIKSELPKAITPMVQGTVADPSKVPEVIKKIEDSIDIDQVISDTWPCLSNLPESQWESREAHDCFTDFLADISQKGMMYTALANAGDNTDMNNPTEVMAAFAKGSDIAANKAMVQHYANALLMDASTLWIEAISFNGGEGKDISADDSDYFNDKKIACGATMFATKDGTVTIDFPDECVRMEERDNRFDISVDEVIEAALAKSKDDLHKHESLTCTGHHCVWKWISNQ